VRSGGLHCQCLTGQGRGCAGLFLIVQSNPFNESAIATVIVAVITSNLGLAQARGNVRLSRTQSGLSKPSVVNVSQLFTVDKGRLTERVTTLSTQVMNRVDEGVQLVLGLRA
jgi:mRNA interferase MazF